MKGKYKNLLKWEISTRNLSSSYYFHRKFTISSACINVHILMYTNFLPFITKIESTPTGNYPKLTHSPVPRHGNHSPNKASGISWWKLALEILSRKFNCKRQDNNNTSIESQIACQRRHKLDVYFIDNQFDLYLYFHTHTYTHGKPVLFYVFYDCPKFREMVFFNWFAWNNGTRCERNSVLSGTLWQSVTREMQI